MKTFRNLISTVWSIFKFPNKTDFQQISQLWKIKMSFQCQSFSEKSHFQLNDFSMKFLRIKLTLMSRLLVKNEKKYTKRKSCYDCSNLKFCFSFSNFFKIQKSRFSPFSFLLITFRLFSLAAVKISFRFFSLVTRPLKLKKSSFALLLTGVSI